MSIVRLLTDADVAHWSSLPLTYTRTDGAGLPHGYPSFTRTRRLPIGTVFDVAAGALLGWQVQSRAGLQVSASSSAVTHGAVCVMRLGPLTIPCRVVQVIAEPGEQGFAYGTLPGHPESGEETFLLRQLPDGAVDFTITAFSRPASALAKAGGPLTRLVQRAVTGRYLRTLDR